MHFKPPQNSEKYQWTTHSVYKMRQYGLSEQRIKRVIGNPRRTEEGIVEKTIAVMQPTSLRASQKANEKSSSKRWSQEIWVMYQIVKKRNSSTAPSKKRGRIRIISAWRYPGVSSRQNPIPKEIVEEVKKVI